ncbi:Biotin-requiring enzyme [Sphingobium sp. AP50]|uniref:lipoyl domain-containing protein n=1 Tax=Sphingobium sp. AP50 TaxID=1884369 RepID=UPI0008B748B4|nr:lipoyl domain-containing protein [Sphingobium sp. AP50]SEJ99054.1 Biotin-requiring enzyme [Sphingobium sp. AP50]
MRLRLKLNRVGMNMSEATIVEWLKQPGDIFADGDALYAIETEKVTQDVTATASGTLIEILVPAGNDAKVGDPICIVDVEAQAQ